MDRIILPKATRNYSNVPLWLALRHGFFTAENLEVDIDNNVTSTDETAERVKAGLAQVTSSAMEQIVIDHERGGPLIAIAGNMNRLPFSLISRPEVRTIADLRGKTVGVSSLNTGTSAIITKVLGEHGLAPGDYRLLAMGPIERRWQMLQTGEIDAGLQGVPLNYIAMDQGYHELADAGSLFPEFQFSCFAIRSDWGRANRDIVVRFLRAELKGVALFYEDREKCTEVAMANAEMPRSYAERAWTDYVRAGVFRRDGELSPAGIQTLLELSAFARGVERRATTRMEDFFDRSYLRAARGEIVEQP